MRLESRDAINWPDREHVVREADAEAYAEEKARVAREEQRLSDKMVASVGIREALKREREEIAKMVLHWWEHDGNCEYRQFAARIRSRSVEPQLGTAGPSKPTWEEFRESKFWQLFNEHTTKSGPAPKLEKIGDWANRTANEITVAFLYRKINEIIERLNAQEKT